MANINNLKDCVSFLCCEINNELDPTMYENHEIVTLVEQIRDIFIKLDNEVNGYPNQKK